MIKSPWIILVTIAVGNLVAGLDRTVVNLAVPRMVQDFHTTTSTISWVATAYLLTVAIFIPVFGKLSDLYGARRVYIFGFTGFTIASVLTGFSWNVGSMIVFRAIQGIFGASVYPTAIALIAENFRDKEARAEALGMQTSILAASLALGPLVSGILIDRFSWPAAFFVNGPIGLIGLLMALKYLPKNEHVPVSKPFDYQGALAFSVVLVGMILVFERGIEWGWTSPQTIALTAVSFLAAILFIRLEKNHSHPFIPLSLFGNRIFRATLLVSLVSYGMLFSFLFLFSLYVQNVLQLNASSNGLLLLPLLVMLSIVSPLGGKMIKRYKPHIPVIIGLLLCALGVGSVAVLFHSASHVFLAISLGLIGAGLGFTSAPLSATATTCVAHEFVGQASGLLFLVRNIAGVIFVAIISILLAAHVSYQALFALSALSALCTLIPSLALRKASL